MASIADKFISEFVHSVAEEVIRRLDERHTQPSCAACAEGRLERLLTPDEAAVILRAKRNTLAVWRLTPGAGPDFIKRGRLVFYTPEALQAYLDRASGLSDDASRSPRPKR